MNKVRHVLGISGGKDSAALAIYMKTKYPSLDIEFYSCDTGKELDETYQLVPSLCRMNKTQCPMPFLSLPSLKMMTLN